jgi:type VI secretion system protein ImpG
MDRRLLGYFNLELQHLRETGAEFAREFPKIAGRLAREEFSCADPYVERPLEGFAFLAARVHLKLDAEFPRFTQGLLETVFPHYLAPTPSMAIAKFEPTRGEVGLATGFKVARGSSVRGAPARGATAVCEYRTAHEVTLWPLEITEAKYYARDLASLSLPRTDGVRAAIRLRLQTTAPVPMNKIELDALPLYLRGSGDLQMRLYEHVVRDSIGVAVIPTTKPISWTELRHQPVKQLGFSEDEALLPWSARSFHGYRMLHEYFALPQRFMFVELSGIQAGMRKCTDDTLDVVILLKEAILGLENALDASNFVPYCTPVINLFPKRCDRIHISDRFSEFHVVPDRTRPRDFEVYQVTGVTGYGVNTTDEQKFMPFYAARDAQETEIGYYTAHRVPRMTSEREQRKGARTRYDGSDVFLSLVDSASAPYRGELKQLGVEALCTNRDLPLLLPTGSEGVDFHLDSGGPVDIVRCVSGVPTAPKSASPEGEYAWRLISHLTLNYLSLVDSANGGGAAALRDLLELYGDTADAAVRKQVEGRKSVSSKPVGRRVTKSGPIAFGRGLDIAVMFDEASFEGTGSFLLGAVLERFFASYVSINSFTRTTVNTVNRGVIMQWPARFGQRQIL